MSRIPNSDSFSASQALQTSLARLRQGLLVRGQNAEHAAAEFQADAEKSGQLDEPKVGVSRDGADTPSRSTATAASPLERLDTAVLNSEIQESITSQIGLLDRTTELDNDQRHGLRKIERLLHKLDDIIEKAIDVKTGPSSSSTDEIANLQKRIDRIIDQIDSVATRSGLDSIPLVNERILELPGSFTEEIQVLDTSLQQNDVRFLSAQIVQEAAYGGLYMDFSGSVVDLKSPTARFEFTLTSNKGGRTFAFASGASLTSITGAVNAFTSQIGATARVSGNTVVIQSDDASDNEFVRIDINSDDTFDPPLEVTDINDPDSTVIVDSVQSFLSRGAAPLIDIPDATEEVIGRNKVLVTTSALSMILTLDESVYSLKVGDVFRLGGVQTTDSPQNAPDNFSEVLGQLDIINLASSTTLAGLDEMRSGGPLSLNGDYVLFAPQSVQEAIDELGVIQDYYGVERKFTPDAIDHNPTDEHIEAAQGIEEDLQAIQNLLLQALALDPSETAAKQSLQLQVEQLMQNIERAGLTPGLMALEAFGAKTMAIAPSGVDMQIVEGPDTSRVFSFTIDQPPYTAGVALQFALPIEDSFNLEIAGPKGATSITFTSGNSLASIAAGINTQYAATGAQAILSGDTIILRSVDPGEDQFISVTADDDSASRPDIQVFKHNGDDGFVALGSLDSLESPILDYGNSIRITTEDGRSFEGSGDTVIVDTADIKARLVINTNSLQDIANISVRLEVFDDGTKVFGSPLDILGNRDVAPFDGSDAKHKLNNLAGGRQFNLVNGDIDAGLKLIEEALTDIGFILDAMTSDDSTEESSSRPTARQLPLDLQA